MSRWSSCACACLAGLSQCASVEGLPLTMWTARSMGHVVFACAVAACAGGMLPPQPKMPRAAATMKG
eukprot:15475827-Alexandrium_andersonii.AAC.1